LCEIEEHDGTDYIGLLMSYISVNNIKHEYFTELMKGWLAGIFYRLENNKYQNKMVIFYGDQGLGKDTFIDNMLSSLDPYLANSGIHEKENDNYAVMARSLVVNVSEFDRTSKIQVSQLKNVITASDATFRAPYDREPKKVDFVTSFISSCNIEDIFRDETGNRRFMFFKLDNIDWNYPKGISKKIIAQAKWLCENKYKPSVEAIDAMAQIMSSATPESWEINASNIWENRVAEIARGRGLSMLEYADVSFVAKEISMSLGVSVRMVQSFINKKYQKRTNRSRLYYASEIIQIN
jgi:hypothetical protein